MQLLIRIDIRIVIKSCGECDQCPTALDLHNTMHYARLQSQIIKSLMAKWLEQASQ